MTTQSGGSLKGRLASVLATAIILPLIALLPVLLASLLVADPKVIDSNEQATSAQVAETVPLETVLVTGAQVESASSEESLVETDHVVFDNNATFTLRIDDKIQSGIIRDSDSFTMTIDDVAPDEILRDADMIKLTIVDRGRDVRSKAADAPLDGKLDRFDLESGCTLTLTMMETNESYDAERIDSHDRYEGVFRIRGDDEEWTSLSDGCKLRFFTADEIDW